MPRAAYSSAPGSFRSGPEFSAGRPRLRPGPAPSARRDHAPRPGNPHPHPNSGSSRAEKMAAVAVPLQGLRRLCRVLLFLSQFYILSGGGE